MRILISSYQTTRALSPYSSSRTPAFHSCPAFLWKHCSKYLIITLSSSLMSPSSYHTISKTPTHSQASRKEQKKTTCHTCCPHFVPPTFFYTFQCEIKHSKNIFKNGVQPFPSADLKQFKVATVHPLSLPPQQIQDHSWLFSNLLSWFTQHPSWISWPSQVFP